MALFQNLILFINHYGTLQEMLEMASFLKYIDLYLKSECGRFYVGHPVFLYLPSKSIQKVFASARWTVEMATGDVRETYVWSLSQTEDGISKQNGQKCQPNQNLNANFPFQNHSINSAL
jgi:hypothetical protein